MNDDDLTQEFRLFEERNRQMRIPRNLSKYYISKKVIEVAYCVVVKSKDPDTNKKVAIKCIPIDNFSQENKEVEIMDRLNHPNIISCLNSFFYPEQKPRFFAIVMPLASMDLYDYTKQLGPVPECIVCQIMYDLLNAVNFLHSNDIWHRDIKPDNIFLMKESQNSARIAIGDFGLSDIFTEEIYEGQATGTTEYAAPELLEFDDTKKCKLGFRSQARYSNKVDTWSLGITMFFLLTKRTPFWATNIYDTERHLRGEIILEPLTKLPTDYLFPLNFVSPEAKSFMASMMNPDPEKRYSMLEALSDPWFESFSKTEQ